MGEVTSARQCMAVRQVTPCLDTRQGTACLMDWAGMAHNRHAVSVIQIVYNVDLFVILILKELYLG